MQMIKLFILIITTLFIAKSCLSDKIYWNDESEKLYSKIQRSIDKVSNLSVIKLEDGCGRMQNRLATLENGDKACIRYRLNTDLMQGEVFSYLLSKLLDIRNIPPISLSIPDDKRFDYVKKQVKELRWMDSNPLILTPFVQNLSPAYIPEEYRSEGFTLTNRTIKDSRRIPELIQWTDMIVFDYITGNVDRIVNNLHNQQWNKQSLTNSAHNLYKAQDFLIFLDNESGLLHSYRILDRYKHLHDRLLNSTCIFRRKTIKNLQNIHHDIESILIEELKKIEPIFERYLPYLPRKSVIMLKDRIKNVLDHVRSCKKLH